MLPWVIGGAGAVLLYGAKKLYDYVTEDDSSSSSSTSSSNDSDSYEAERRRREAELRREEEQRRQQRRDTQLSALAASELGQISASFLSAGQLPTSFSADTLRRFAAHPVRDCDSALAALALLCARSVSLRPQSSERAQLEQLLHAIDQLEHFIDEV